MKASAIIMATLGFIFLLGCSKSAIIPGKPEVLPVNLTQCESGSCQFLYSEWSDLKNEYSPPNIGSFRVFKVEFLDEGVSRTLWLKAPMTGVAFSITTQEIQNGKALLATSCPQCRIIPLRPVSGSVEGNRIARDDMTGPETWILDIKLNLSDGSGSITKAMYVKQIFYPDFIRPETSN